MTHSTILTSVDGAVGTLTLNRPDALNALSAQMQQEVHAVMARWGADDAVRAVIVTGSDKAFAAGADIKEMQHVSAQEAGDRDFMGGWDSVANCRKPTIAAVAGHALGGGCELAMMCDVIVAADNAVFGQPEIKLGVIPGLGGTQRLTRLVGRAMAMDMVLTGRNLSADEALRAGLVSRVVPLAELNTTARSIAARIAAFSPSSIRVARNCVNTALCTTLDEGLKSERRAFYDLFGSDAQREGMAAFVEKRKAEFS